MSGTPAAPVPGGFGGAQTATDGPAFTFGSGGGGFGPSTTPTTFGAPQQPSTAPGAFGAAPLNPAVTPIQGGFSIGSGGGSKSVGPGGRRRIVKARRPPVGPR
jgi:hypothetical protein